MGRIIVHFSSSLREMVKEIIENGGIEEPLPKTELERWNEAVTVSDLRAKGCLVSGDRNPMEDLLREEE